MSREISFDVNDTETNSDYQLTFERWESNDDSKNTRKIRRMVVVKRDVNNKVNKNPSEEKSSELRDDNYHIEEFNKSEKRKGYLDNYNEIKQYHMESIFPYKLRILQELYNKTKDNKEDDSYLNRRKRPRSNACVCESEFFNMGSE